MSETMNIGDTDLAVVVDGTAEIVGNVKRERDGCQKKSKVESEEECWSAVNMRALTLLLCSEWSTNHVILRTYVIERYGKISHMGVNSYVVIYTSTSPK